MKYAAVLDGRSEHIRKHAQQLQSAVQLLSLYDAAATVIIYDDEALRASLVEHALSEDIILVKADSCLRETLLEVLQNILVELSPDLCIFPGTYAGNETAARLSVRMNGSCLTSVHGCTCTDDRLLCRKKVYSGYLTGIFELQQKPWFVTVSHEADSEAFGARRSRRIREIDVSGRTDSYIVEYRRIKEDRSASLESAKRIVAAGRGAGSREAVKELTDQAALFGAELGVTRCAAMNGWAPMNRILGASGVIARPEVCIVLGASGSPAFLAGIEKSTFIASVNRDPSAPITSCVDAAVIDDCIEVMNELTAIMKEEKHR